jgi:hypothetical protein
VRRRAPPPDFRYVGLEPGPPGSEVSTTTVAVGAGAFGLGLVAGGSPDLASLLGAATAGALAAWLAARLRGPVLRRPGTLEAAIELVPWGAIVAEPSGPRVLRWAALRSVEVRRVHFIDEATPRIAWTIVTLHGDRRSWVGRAPGAVDLTRLETHLADYAHEAAARITLGGIAPDDDDEPPRFHELVSAARNAATSRGELREARSLRSRELAAGPESRAWCARLLADAPDDDDPRPLAAVVAGELGFGDLAPALSSLVSSPHPMVALSARAALLRLGRPPASVGALDELEQFVDGDDLDAARVWAAS